MPNAPAHLAVAATGEVPQTLARALDPDVADASARTGHRRCAGDGGRNRRSPAHHGHEGAFHRELRRQDRGFLSQGVSGCRRRERARRRGVDQGSGFLRRTCAAAVGARADVRRGDRRSRSAARRHHHARPRARWRSLLYRARSVRCRFGRTQPRAARAAALACRCTGRDALGRAPNRRSRARHVRAATVAAAVTRWSSRRRTAGTHARCCRAARCDADVGDAR